MTIPVIPACLVGSHSVPVRLPERLQKQYGYDVGLDRMMSYFRNMAKALVNKQIDSVGEEERALQLAMIANTKDDPIISDYSTSVLQESKQAMMSSRLSAASIRSMTPTRPRSGNIRQRSGTSG
jgi:hypothetical protein